MILLTIIAISCAPLDTSSLKYGIISYFTDSVWTVRVEDQYDCETTATYQCDSGYELTGGDTVRTCTGDGSSPEGQWSETAPVCTGKITQWLKYF